MSSKDEGHESLFWLLRKNGHEVEFVHVVGHLARVVEALNQDSELGEERLDQLWQLLESYVPRLRGEYAMELLWSSLAKRLLPKDPLRLCEAVVTACEGHRAKFYPSPTPRQPLPEVLERVSDCPKCRDLLDQAVKAGRGGPFLRTCMERAFPQPIAESSPPLVITRSAANRKAEEQDLVCRFLKALGLSVDRLVPRESPDFEVESDGRKIGIEVTVFHADEGGQTGGSALRRQEQKIARNAEGTPYAMWGSVKWEDPFVKRIQEKIGRARQFDRNGLDELWLLVVGSAPIWEAIVSTLAPSVFVTPEKLQEISGSFLEQSTFDGAFFYLVMDNRLFQRRKASKWVEIKI